LPPRGAATGKSSVWGVSLAKKERPVPDKTNDTVIATVMEQLMAEGPQAMVQIITALMNLAMRMEREQFLGAGHYERAVDRRGYANGTKPKLVDTLAGTLSLEVPKTAGMDEPYYPQALERGRRSCRAVMLAIAEMYVCGVSTRDVERVMAEFGLKSLSSTQVSRAAKLLDDELQAWRCRTLGEVRYLFLDARYEKSRQGGVVRDAAVLSAFGVGPDGRRRILGVSVAVSEAEVHWRAFLEDLVTRGMRGVQFVTSDDHAGLEAARKAVLGGAIWQRCQFHLAQNAIHHAPTVAIRKRIGSQLREIWNAKNLAGAEAELKSLVEAHRNKAPDLASWLEVAIPEGLAVFTLPEHHRKRMRTSNPIERAVQQELKRRTVKVRVFPNNDSLLRLVTAVLVEIDETWQASTQPYINWNTPDA
jgi:putative transposase